MRLDSDPASHGFADSGNELRNFLQPSGSNSPYYTTSPIIAPTWNGQTNFFTDFGSNYGTPGSPVLEVSKATIYLVISHVDKVGIGALQGEQFQSSWIFTSSDFDALVAAGVTQANLDLHTSSKATAIASTFGDPEVLASDSTVFHNKNGTVTLDECRLGTTPADVTPLAGAPAGYDAWIESPAYNTPTALTTAQKLLFADPDSDGISILLEFALGGNPVTSSEAILPVETLDTSNINLVFNRSDLSESSTSIRVETSETLNDWNTIPPIQVGATSSAGATISENGAADDTINVIIPATRV